jgi:lysophospholipase L1-like esterase
MLSSTALASGDNCPSPKQVYRFQVCAYTQPGESIALVGSHPAMGAWDIYHCVRLQTSSERYPLWWADLHLEPQGADKADYKYVRVGAKTGLPWEGWGRNRWIPLPSETVNAAQATGRHSSHAPIIVEDGWFGRIPSWPYGYFQTPPQLTPAELGPQGLKIVVLGSSVAMGCSAWLLEGWAKLLGDTLQAKYGHQLINVSELGSNVSRAIERFPQVVAPERPDVVIIGLSLGNEGLAHCSLPERRVIQKRFEAGLQQLIALIRELGAYPVLGAVYPNDAYQPEHAALLQDTHQRMLRWGVPVLDWLAVVQDGLGRWAPGLSLDPAHPNHAGHRAMFEAIDLSIFDPNNIKLATQNEAAISLGSMVIFDDHAGFEILVDKQQQQIQFSNTSAKPFDLTPQQQAVQFTLQHQASLTPGIYLAHPLENAPPIPPEQEVPFFSVDATGSIETVMQIPAGAKLAFRPAFNLFAATTPHVLFYDGYLAIVKESDTAVRIVNESQHEYNLHPMWKDLRSALKAMPSGVYHDPQDLTRPFSTLMIGPEGIESRVKAPPKSSILLHYQCKLSEISRVAILPLGARCAARMALYKMELDGPAFPFDLTRVTNLSDVADMIACGFEDMWNPAYLRYSPSDNRLYHRKWSSFSYGHEVEDDDEPLKDLSPVFARMKKRYTSRTKRFWYTIEHADKILFVRNGSCDRNQVIDLMHQLKLKCGNKPFRLLLISPQESVNFANLPDVVHYNFDFNPDRMYADQGYWMECTQQMREILTTLNVSSQNLFWCPI